MGNLKTAENGATVGDGADSAGKSKKANGGKDVAVDELPEDGVDNGDDVIGDMHENVENE